MNIIGVIQVVWGKSILCEDLKGGLAEARSRVENNPKWFSFVYTYILAISSEHSQSFEISEARDSSLDMLLHYIVRVSLEKEILNLNEIFPVK